MVVGQCLLLAGSSPSMQELHQPQPLHTGHLRATVDGALFYLGHAPRSPSTCAAQS